MVLLKYFKPLVAKKKDPDECASINILPDPEGPLSQLIPSSAILAANKDVAKVLKWEGGQGTEEFISRDCRGKYQHYTSKERAEIGKRAAEFGLMSAVRHYSKIFPDQTLLVSSVY